MLDGRCLPDGYGRAGQRSDAPHLLVAKCLPAARLTEVAVRTAAVQRATTLRQGLLRVPALVQVDLQRGVLLQWRAQGQALSDWPQSDVAGLAHALERCAGALRELHELPAEATCPEPDGAGCRGSASHDIAAQLDALVRPHPGQLAQQCVPLRPRLLALLDRLQQEQARLTAVSPRLLHRDVHPRQLFVSLHHVDLIDWDLCGAGDPALDLASLHLHVDLRWPALADQLHAAVARGYGTAGHNAGERLSLFLALQHLRRACKAYRLATGVEGHVAPPLDTVRGWLLGAERHLDDAHAGRPVRHGLCLTTMETPR
jgi:aminoglycoside/choline kinase family phosphotransferase